MTTIGGYFELAESDGEGIPWLGRAIGYRSARSALAAVLSSMQLRSVWVPGYVCPAVDDAVRHAGVELYRYPLSQELGVPADLRVDAHTAVICVDYFGLCGEQVSRCIERYGAHRVVVDASQSMYRSRIEAETVVYSPRKMFGVPDGGLVLTDRRLDQPKTADEMHSAQRSSHLLLRRAGLIADGYKAFGQSEASLSGCEPIALSDLTRGLLKRVAYQRAAERRRINFSLLSRELRLRGYSAAAATEAAVPMCCPVAHDAAHKVRNLLAEQGIYTPSYWPGAPTQANDAAGIRLRDHTVFLPCDQRYGEQDMERITQAMSKLRNIA